ncbi:MAG: histidine kinase [Actinomycetaceae bacterium]|nr:histidine kinase [Actinomycetaceae bacterium]MDY6083467.1 histidine kinase [Actinomycetaceae bacterium]
MVQPILFVTAAGVFVVIDAIVNATFYHSGDGNLLLSVALSVCFGLAGFFQTFEFAFVALLLVTNALNVAQAFSAANYGLFILIILWLIRSWIVPSVLVLLVYGITSTVVSTTPSLQAFSSALICVLILAIGLALRWQNKHRLLAQRQLEQAERSVVETRAELARQLHDTTAKDLAHVAVLAQDIVVRHPELSEEINPLIHVATDAAKRIRPMILTIDTSASEATLSEVVQQATQMLQTRSIVLDSQVPDGVDDVLTRQQQKTGTLAIRECASNILKYAPAGSRATLVIDITDEPQTLTMALSNKIADKPVTDMSTGYGLANLRNRIHGEGGTMEATNVGGRWLIYITLPAGPRSAAPVQRHSNRGVNDAEQ